jgi:hypothetical protein
MAERAENIWQSEDRINAVLSWINKNRILLFQADGVKLQIDVKGTSVVGNVTLYPENK